MADRAQIIRVLPSWPRALREDMAAEYVGLAPTTFRREVDAERIPPPVQLTPGRQAWLIEDLDAYLSLLGRQSQVRGDWMRAHGLRPLEPGAAPAPPSNGSEWMDALGDGPGGPALPHPHPRARP